MSVSDALMRARCRLLQREPWYGHVAMRMVWTESQMPWMPEPQRTMGVRIMSNYQVECIYYPPFVEKLKLEELYAVIQHEIEHIVRMHCLRIGSRIPEAWNIAADMTVNGPRSAPRIGYTESGKADARIIPMVDEICWIPEDWKKDDTAENFYARLTKDQKRVAVEVGDDGTYRFGEYQGKPLDNHDIWNMSDASQDVARQIVKDLVHNATQECGSHPGHLSDAIKQLSKPVVRWREMLRQYLGKHLGNSRKTFSRANRRTGIFGMPGVSHHAASTATVIIDTSGSVGQAELQQFFAEIDMISSKTKTNVLMWDHAFQGYGRYRKNMWRNWEIKGRGGTDMAAPVMWLIEKHLISDVIIMLTDGFCNYAPEQSFPMVTVITNASGSKPEWGKVVMMNLNNES